MFNVELLADRIARTNLERRRNKETERQQRIFNAKVRTIGVDKEALDLQVKDKKKQEEIDKDKQKAYDAEMLQNYKVACLLHNQQEKEKRAVEKDIVNYRHQYQQPWCQREYDLNDPECCRKMDEADAQMILPGLVGEDPDSRSRQQRQRQQFREWLIQQQTERAAETHEQRLEKQRYDQSRVDMDNRALQLQNMEMQRRKAAAVATKESNLSMTEEKRRKEQEHKDQDYQPATTSHLQGQQTGLDVESGTSSDRRTSGESLQQVIQFQKHQIEEKKRRELERKKEEEQLDRVRLDSARTALLTERQQARLNKQLRRHQDNTNIKLAVSQKQKPDIERGCINDSFFDQFNTTSR